ncbi:hypothetical protein HPB47_015903 [Ixodes persulcatus]|uniref:Uncharacterized protein n=1 Tax=Ixodes persulcatus TaxID=34615 RepID=A0AC60QSB2_IXOPE|nr:hypothetical protein HPB47_015903 [Ixodes persulcatus]
MVLWRFLHATATAFHISGVRADVFAVPEPAAALQNLVLLAQQSGAQPELRFHQFPRDEKRRKVWVDAVRRTDFGRPWTPSSNAKLCSEHFTPDSYARDLRLLSAAGFSTKHASLRKDAVPSLFAYRPPAAPARAAYNKRRRIETVNEALAAGPSAAACAPPPDASSTPEAADDGDAFAAGRSAPTGDASTAEAAEGGVTELDSAIDVDEGSLPCRAPRCPQPWYLHPDANRSRGSGTTDVSGLTPLSPRTTCATIIDMGPGVLRVTLSTETLFLDGSVVYEERDELHREQFDGI